LPSPDGTQPPPKLDGLQPQQIQLIHNPNNKIWRNN